jgi:hypothetical protein
VSEPEQASAVPGAEAATTDARKFTEYLLNKNHPVGRAKAKFFRGAGYDESNWEDLWTRIAAQLPHVEARYRGKARHTEADLYEAPMRIDAPNGPIEIQTAWEVHPTTGTRFLTSYPL